MRVTNETGEAYDPSALSAQMRHAVVEVVRKPAGRRFPHALGMDSTTVQAAHALSPSVHHPTIIHDTAADEREVGLKVRQTLFGYLERVVR